MFNRRRASPKHRYNMTEVEYGGGGHRTRLRDQEINCCVLEVPPTPVYKGAKGEGAASQGGRAKGGVLLPPGVGLPSFLVGVGEGGRRRERGRKGGAPPPSPCPTWTRGEGRAAQPLPPLLLSTRAHVGPLSPPGGSGNLPVLR